ncbi:hypothetical protein [Actinoplanes flavus]|uniref:Uncharacterized protein n=1 Tax=Actinoplanes flavus TaxID=2820290 RepID=A0ABS3UI34_9ACTN|nr:hypothetical protein [Actinoplanes flavus]MBO3738411.1 hypothetical protein [Actinoplanes flavus]
MTTTALIPRVRRNHHGRAIAIRCTACGAWRKPYRFTRNAVTCRRCPYGPVGRHLATYAAKRR